MDVPPLTVADRLALNDLYAAYAWRFDEGDAEGWAALFTADGRFTSVGRDELSGRDELAAFVRHRHAEKPGIRHHTTNVTVEATAGGAHGRAYALALRSSEESPLRLLNAGAYDDELVREPDGWHFARRSFRSWLPEEARDAELRLELP
jgi:SnoaL-like domain